MARKMIVTHTQDMIIRKHLENDDMSLSHEDLVEAICKETDAERWIVDKYVENWRYWHPNGGGGGLRGSTENTDKPRNEEYSYVGTPLPKPKQPKSNKAPEDGSGIVAQILKLAAEGKSVKEIIEAGYNKSTVYRQVSEWKKRNASKGKSDAAQAAPNEQPAEAVA